MGDWFKSLGCYPPTYNPKVHGPYAPHRYYGPKDTAFSDVKLGELKDWLSRRDKSPRGFFNAFSRLTNLYAYKWSRPRNATGAVLVQFCVLASLGWYVCSFEYNSEYFE